MAPSPLVFKVRRKEPKLLAPAKPTPLELKQLSVLDDREVIRILVPLLIMCRNNPSMKGKDPVKVIRDAIAQTLVYYYPLAGRLREGPDRKLSVDCTGEGLMYVEADADVALDDFGTMLHPPFPCVEELLFELPSSAAMILQSPLLFIQVTRLKCGGFIFSLLQNHTICDASGTSQFVSAVGEIARGALFPSIPPSWNREFFRARDPPRVTHRYFDGDATFTPFDDNHDDIIIEKYFFCGPSQISALRSLVLHNCSTFDLLTACVWRCRTIALQFDPKDDVYILFPFNTRSLSFEPPLPRGYYGNAVTVMVASAKAGSLCDTSSFGYALELIRKAKAEVNEEYVRSMVDLIAMRGYVPVPGMAGGRCFVVTDLRVSGFGDVDLGWGRAAYGGVAMSSIRAMRGLATSYVACENHEGEEGMVVQMCFPRAAMQIFENELDSMLNHKTHKSHFIKSGL